MDNNFFSDFISTLLFVSVPFLLFESLACLLLRKFVFKRPIKLLIASISSGIANVLITTVLSLVFDISFSAQGILNIVVTSYILNHGYSDYKAQKNLLCSMPNIDKYDCAYLRVMDYVDGMYDKIIGEEAEKLAIFTIECLYFCSAYAIFHANPKQKHQVKDMRESLKLKQASIKSLRNTNLNSRLDLELDNFNQQMLKIKKSQVDPAYLQDKSKENYEHLLKTYLEQACELLGVECYEGIVEDFKRCMNEK